MTLKIDWDNYEVIEAEDFTPSDLENTMEDVREAMDNFATTMGAIPEQLEELMETLGELEGEMNV